MSKHKSRALFEVSFKGFVRKHLLSVTREIMATSYGHAIAQFRRIYRTPNQGTDRDGTSIGYRVLHPADRRA